MSRRRRSAGAGTVRIIGGRWRGRRLSVPSGAAVRPTPDRVRETLFNWLREAVEGARCLDLFAGTGVLGFEALSRGAAEAWLIERDPRLVAALEQSAAALDAAAARIIGEDARRFLERSRPPATFDIVFVDPPYADPLGPVLEGLSGWLEPQALVYVERRAGEPLPAAGLHRQGRAGDVAFGLIASGTGARIEPTSGGEAD